MILVIASAYWWGPVPLRSLSFFAVRRVEVSGTRYLAVDDVVRGMELGPQANVFDDLRAIERRLESLGGVSRARVTRRLPATLVAEVTEVEPVALAEGPEGLVALGADAHPLPYDLTAGPVDAPIVRDAEAPLVQALALVQATDLGLYGDVTAAHSGVGEVVLDMAHGRLRLRLPVDPEVVRSVSSVRRDLAARGTEWRELDGRYRGWIVVRRLDGLTARRLDSAPVRAPTASSPRTRGRAATRSSRQAVKPSSRH